MISPSLLFFFLFINHVLKPTSYFFISSVKMKYETLPVIDAMMDPSLSASTTQELTTALNQGKKNSFNISKFFKYPPSIAEWHTVDTAATTVTILSMSVDHHADSPWYIPALHDKYSIGWNRTREYGFSTRPYACSLRFFGIALESVLEGYQQGGNGYLTVGFVSDQQRQMWHGFDKNETNKLYCYYITNKDTGSEFIDKPKTLGVAINCPVLLDEEMGPFIFQHTLQFGKYCRPFAEYPVTVEIHLRPSSYRQQSTDANNNKEIIADFRSNPSEIRTVKMKEMSLTTPMSENRPHAVCTVQTFRNPYSGAMLYAFVKYYQLLGWRVIIYDRFGFHYQYLRELISLPGVDYYPFTVFQLANPSKYNKDYILQQGIDLKIFYQMEKNWGYTKGAKLADTADQDADKTRTYDYARLEYRHLDSILYLDSDEFFFCPQASQSVQAQRIYQQKIHHEFIARGIEEMRYVRIPYSGLAPPGFVNSPQNRSTIDFTEHTSRCMHQAYERKNLYELMACWSKGSSYDNFAKSADMAGVCPFHYNHWSCDGMKGGGRDWTKVRCRCKVALDMQNFYEYRPILKRCHIMHFNDNKYRFQARRSKHQYDRGDITAINPIAVLLGNDRSWNQTVINESNHHSNSSSTHH